MDYHLDWIEMALDRAANNESGATSPFPKEKFPKINKNQMDVDMLVAFDHNANGEVVTHLV